MMNKINFSFLIVFLLSCFSVKAQYCKWIMGYLPTYHQSSNGQINFLTSSDYGKMTHLMHFGPVANSDGSLGFGANSTTYTKLQVAVATAHQHNTPVLLSISAWVSAYLPAITDPGSRTFLIENILDLLDTYEYDGVDIDLEPIMSPYVGGIQSDNVNYEFFINELYDSLQTRTTTFLQRTPLLTCAANAYSAPVLYRLQDKFDMINLMTYDMSGPYPGWLVWHDSPVYNGGATFSFGGQLPSVHGDVQYCLNAGISPYKLGIGVSFDAFRWKGGTGTSTGGATAPTQQYATDPSWTRFSYSEMMSSYYNPANYHWDAAAQMSYLSYDLPGSANDEFWSYNDEASCAAKMQYVYDYHLGGVILWELYGGYIASQPSYNRIPQLTAINDALICIGFTPSIEIENVIFLPNSLPREFLINISEIMSGTSIGTFEIKIQKNHAFTYSFSPTMAFANVFGQRPLDNSRWTKTETQEFITLTLNPGEVLNPYDVASLGMTIERNAGVPQGTFVPLTVTIVNGSGGDTDDNNNTYNVTIKAQ